MAGAADVGRGAGRNGKPAPGTLRATSALVARHQRHQRDARRAQAAGKGDTPPRDADTAAESPEDAEAAAACLSGDHAYIGHGVPQSYDAAVASYLRAARANHPAAMSRLGLCYQHGRGVARSEESALYWFHRAAKRRDAEALNALGGIHQAGTWEGCPQDYLKAGE